MLDFLVLWPPGLMKQRACHQVHAPSVLGDERRPAGHGSSWGGARQYRRPYILGCGGWMQRALLSGLAQWSACWVQNPKARGSKPRSATWKPWPSIVVDLVELWPPGLKKQQAYQGMRVPLYAGG